MGGFVALARVSVLWISLISLLRLKIDDTIEADRVFTMLMDHEVEPHSNFMETNALRAGNIDLLCWAVGANA